MSATTESPVAIPGGHLHARADGAEGKPWLVLSNSFATDHAMWDNQVTALSGRYRVLRYDTRGHGRSGAPPAPYAFPDLIADVIAVMDHHGAERASFMGLSLGGMTGLGIALAHPDRIERLVCCCARADAPEPFRKSWDDRLAIVAREGTAGVVSGNLERWLTPTTRAARPHEAERLAAMIRGTSEEGYRGCAAALKSLDYAGDLPSMRVPTLYLAGAQDAATPPAAMRAMAEATPGARFAEVADAAHIANVDQPERFAAALRDFLL